LGGTNKFKLTKSRTHNKRFAKSTAEVQHSSFVILLYICAKVQQKFFNAVPSASRQTLPAILMTTQYDINWLTEKFESGDTLKYIFFWGHTNKYNEEVGKFCFSQWFESPFTVDNITYKTAEHWMMAHKALLFGDKLNFDKIINCEKPGEAKVLGRQVLGYDEQTWNDRKYEIVKLGNIHKFNQHPQFADYLLKTENRILVEASPVDTIWGIGLSQDSNDIENIYAWRGQNLLGFALMATRDCLVLK
jgi:ribA/ribD-fused uncharacterized protein